MLRKKKKNKRAFRSVYGFCFYVIWKGVISGADSIGDTGGPKEGDLSIHVKV